MPFMSSAIKNEELAPDNRVTASYLSYKILETHEQQPLYILSVELLLHAYIKIIMQMRKMAS